MARLPQPGGDSGNWGEILNTFLSESHNADGSLKDASISAKTITSGRGADGQVLTYDSTQTGGMKWAPVDETVTAVMMGGGLSGLSSNAQLNPQSVGANELADGAVTSAKIADGSIKEADLDPALVTKFTSTTPTQTNADWNATSGSAQILNKPNLSTVATSGSYDDLSDAPTLASVATSGSYNDLADKPAASGAQVNADWNATAGVANILNKPALSPVATSGSYTDLTNKPDVYTKAEMDVTKNDIVTSLAGKVNTSQVGVANGIAGLDASGKVPASQLPAAPASDPTLGGDLTGTASNAQTAAGTVGAAELAASAPTTGQVLSYNGTGLTWAAPTAGDAANGTATIEGIPVRLTVDGTNLTSQQRTTLTNAGWLVLTATGGSVTPADTTPPTAGTLSVTTTANSSITVTVTGASDAGGLNSAAYSFSSDNGATWSIWQAGASYTYTGLTPSTTYTLKHQVRDAAGNIVAGASISQATSADATVLPTGYAYRWKAQDLALADNAAVTAWTAESGTDGLTIVGAPTYKADATRPYVHLDAVDDGLLAESIGTVDKPLTIVLVCQVHSATLPNGDKTDGWFVLAKNGMAGFTWDSSLTNYSTFSSSSGVMSSNSVAIDTNWHVLVFEINGTSGVISVDGVTTTTSATSFSANDVMGGGICFGFELATPSNKYYTPLNYSDMIVYKRALSATEIADATSVLKAKYGI